MQVRHGVRGEHPGDPGAAHPGDRAAAGRARLPRVPAPRGRGPRLAPPGAEALLVPAFSTFSRCTPVFFAILVLAHLYFCDARANASVASASDARAVVCRWKFFAIFDQNFAIFAIFGQNFVKFR